MSKSFTLEQLSEGIRGRDVGADDLSAVTKELANPAQLAIAKVALGL